MSLKNFWTLLYLALFAALLYFGIRAALFYTQYENSKATTETTSISFQVKGNWLGIYFLDAHYSYQVEGETYQKQELLSKTQANSEEYLLAEKKKLAARPWKVWYNPSKPDQAFLEKYFPYREIFNSLILLGILIYFLFLQRYIKKRVA